MRHVRVSVFIASAGAVVVAVLSSCGSGSSKGGDASVIDTGGQGGNSGGGGQASGGSGGDGGVAGGGRGGDGGRGGVTATGGGGTGGGGVAGSVGSSGAGGSSSGRGGASGGGGGSGGGSGGSGGSGGGSGGRGGSGGAVALPPAGEHFCLSTNPPETVWDRGWETMCRVTAAHMPPLSAAQRQMADERCTRYGLGTVVQACPPRGDVIAFCTLASTGNGGAGTQTWDLVYRTSVLPDVEAAALNRGQPVCPYMYDLTGREITRRPCLGSVTARVNGVMKTFNWLSCEFKSDGVRSRYFINADSMEGAGADRMILLVLKTGAVVSFQTTDPLYGPAYYGGADGTGGGFDVQMMTLSATTFLDRGAGLVATFTLGESTSPTPGRPTATVTDGTIDIRIGPAP